MIPSTRSWRSGWGQPLEHPQPVEFSDAGGSGGANNPPRWPEATAIVKRILKAYQQDAKDWQRINDWIDRIGGPRFFELTILPFTKFHVDNWRGSRKSLNASTYIRF